jgi:hypothetical protein
MNRDEFISRVTELAKSHGYPIERNRNGQDQIDFGNKKLHSGHFAKLYPKILLPSANVSKLIDEVAPGRPCSHRPMKDILRRIDSESGISC